MHINFWVILLSALVPLVLGFIWYHPKVFGNAWMSASGMSPESTKGMNMAVIFGLSVLFALFIAGSLTGIVIQQTQTAAMLLAQPDSKDPSSESSMMLKRFLELYGNSYRTFRHGALHGLLTGLFLVLPVIGTHALFEKKGFRYIAINAGYWIVSMIIMGGIISAFA
jgi:hypothetical protein